MVNKSEWVTAKELAAMVGCSVNAIYVAKCKRKSYVPKAYKFGRKLLFRRVDVEAAIVPMQD